MKLSVKQIASILHEHSINYHYDNNKLYAHSGYWLLSPILGYPNNMNFDVEYIDVTNYDLHKLELWLGY